MKLVFLRVETKSPEWFSRAQELYLKKIKNFYPLEEIEIRSPQIQRKDQAQKIEEEAKKILAKIKPNDWVILFDEKGKSFSSLNFASELQLRMERSPSRIVFVIGGAFGVSDLVRERAQDTVSLSPMTMNHLVAQVMAYEQVYRALTIQKNIPYHNE